MTRFFVRADQIEGDVVLLDEGDALHIGRVLRLAPGDEIAVVDGTGREYTAALTEIGRARAAARITAYREPRTEPSVAVTVAQAYPKSAEKLEWVLQHGVEVGAAGFWLTRSRRSEGGRLGDAAKRERWERIVKTAAEQSGRVRLPELRQFDGVPALCEAARAAPGGKSVDGSADAGSGAAAFDLALLCDETETERTLKSALAAPTAPPRRVLLLIGPEGGWSPEERAACLRAGAVAVTLGARILRTETAALATLSQLLYALDAG